MFVFFWEKEEVYYGFNISQNIKARGLKLLENAHKVVPFKILKVYFFGIFFLPFVFFGRAESVSTPCHRNKG